MRNLAVTIAVLALAASAFAYTDVAPVHNYPTGGEGSFPILHSWGMPDDPYCVGLGYDGTYFWVSAGDQAGFGCRFYIYDDLGNLMDTRPQGAGATGWGHRDMCWDGNYMHGSYSSQINGFDASSAHMGFWMGPGISPCRAMGFDGIHFYACGFGEFLWQGTWDGNWGSTGSWTMLTGTTISGAYGLAHDGSNSCLWMTVADYSGNLFQYDTSGNLLNTYTFLPEYDIQGGCAMAITSTWGCVLGVLHQSDPDQVALYDVGCVVPVEQQSWGGVKARFR